MVGRPKCEQKSSAKYLFVDLENLAFIASSLQPLSYCLSRDTVLLSLDDDVVSI